MQTDLAYQLSFAHYPSEVSYVDVWKGIDNRKLIAERLEKALSIAGSGQYLVPVYVDPQIIDLTRKATPLVELIPRVANRGKSADFNRITTLGSVGFKGEDAALAEADDTYVRYSANVRYLYGVGRVTGQILAAAAEYIDAMNQEVLMKTKQLRYIEEHAILNSQQGTGTQASKSPFNQQGYDGLIVQQANATCTGLGQYTGAGDFNVTSLSGAALDIVTMRASITKARNFGGEPKLIVTDWASVDVIKGLLMEFQRYVDTTRLAWGIETLSFDGIPVIGSRFLADRGAGFGQSAGAYLTPLGSSYNAMLFLDTDVLEMRVLQDIVFERLAKVSDADKFMLKLYEVVLNKAPEFNAMIYYFT